MPVESETSVEKIERVKDNQGNAQPAANEKQQQKTNDRLGNWDSVYGFTYSTESTNAEQLPANAVPNGTDVLIQADPGNSGRVYIGNDTDQPVSIAPEGTATVPVTDTSAIHVRTPTSGDSVGVFWADD